MRISRQWFSGAVVVTVAILLGSVRPAVADSYTIFDLGSDNGRGFYGIDTAGDVVVQGSSGCGASSPICYVTYTDGLATATSSTAPDLVYDDGSPCGSTPAGFNALKSVCNNGWIGLGSIYNPNGDPNGVYVGSASDLQLIHFGSADNKLFLNSAGDFAWTDGTHEELYLAIANSSPFFESQSALGQEDFDPASTPEPASLLLVASGLVLFLAAVRRKASRQATTHLE